MQGQICSWVFASTGPACLRPRTGLEGFQEAFGSCFVSGCEQMQNLSVKGAVNADEVWRRLWRKLILVQDLVYSLVRYFAVLLVVHVKFA